MKFEPKKLEALTRYTNPRRTACGYSWIKHRGTSSLEKLKKILNPIGRLSK